MGISRSKIGAARRDERGFTLPEILITIIIMGILFAIATSTWNSVIESRRVDSATNQVMADLRLAHSSATNRLAAARVEFSSTGAPVTCGSTSADYCLVQPGSPSRARNFESDNVRLTSPNLVIVGGASVVEFQASGSASTPGATLGLVTGVTDNCPAGTPTGVARLQVTEDGNPVHCITFNTATSRIRVD